MARSEPPWVSAAGRLVPWLLAAAAAAAGALTSSRPTGDAVLDRVYPALLAALFTLAARRCPRGVLILAAAVAAAMSRSWILIPAFAGLLVAFGGAFLDRPDPVVNTVAGALTAEVLLRWPSSLFFGFPSLIATAVVVLVLAGAFQASSRAMRVAGGTLTALVVLLVLVLGVAAAAGAFLARTSADAGTGLARTALADIKAGDAPGAVAALRRAAADFGTASTRAGAWWTRGGELIPIVAQHRRAIVDLTSAAGRLTGRASAEAGAVDYHRLGYHNGSIDLAAVEQMAGPVQALDADIVAAQARVRAVRSPWLVGPLRDRIDSLAAQLSAAQRTARLGAEGVAAAPRLFGAHGVRRYFVAFMSPAEDRGLDGFIGAYGILTADRGRVTLTGSGRAATLGPAPGRPPPHLSTPVEWVDRYGAFEPELHFQDLTYSPDFPSDASVIAELFPQMEAGTHIDGVLALDPYALAALLNFTGPITVAGFPAALTPANAADVLLRQQYLQPGQNPDQDPRHNVLQQALASGFSKLSSGSLPDPRALSADLGPEVRQRRLLFWASDPEVQPFLASTGLLGSMPRPGGDLLALTLANYDNNKIDAYLHEALSDRIHYDPATGATTEDVAVTLANDAPATGLPPYVIGSFPGSGVAPGADREWVSLYTSLNVQAATVDGRRLTLTGPLPEAGTEAWSGYVTVPPRSEIRLKVTLAGRLPAGPGLNQTLVLQPLCYPVSATVGVALPSGWSPTSPSRISGSGVQELRWRATK